LFSFYPYYVHMVTIISHNGPGPAAPDALRARARGRGTGSNRSGRFEPLSRELVDDGWQGLERLPGLKTHVTEERARSIITTNQSPDIGFDRSINPYRGCEHGCSYCFARPSHAFMGLSPGLDFESRIFAKTNAADVLRRSLSQPRYQPKTIAIGTNTDPYQPIERERRIMRRILEVLAEFKHPVAIVTKSALVERDLDLLGCLARDGLVKMALSITTLDPKLARAMEPRASAPALRLKAIETLAQAGIPTAVMTAPVIPALNDQEIEAILARAAAAGAKEAGYILLRLPLEVRDLFFEWLKNHYPDRAGRVISLIRNMRQGKDYDATWGARMRGSGPYAWSIGRRFELACKKLKLNTRSHKLDTSQFRRPGTSRQLNLFEAE
jgi:DNA repair photolyase